MILIEIEDISRPCGFFEDYAFQHDAFMKLQPRSVRIWATYDIITLFHVAEQGRQALKDFTFMGSPTLRRCVLTLHACVAGSAATSIKVM